MSAHGTGAEGITVNGEPREAVPSSVRALVEAEGLDPERRGLAVARNGHVVPRTDWAETPLAAGDRVEIVKPFSGG
jgi:sulfur carrier protein